MDDLDLLDPTDRLRFVRLGMEAVAANHAVRSGDIDEARFRIHSIRVIAAEARWWGVWRAARAVAERIGEAQACLDPGYDESFAILARRLSRRHP